MSSLDRPQLMFFIIFFDSANMYFIVLRSPSTVYSRLRMVILDVLAIRYSRSNWNDRQHLFSNKQCKCNRLRDERFQRKKKVRNRLYRPCIRAFRNKVFYRNKLPGFNILVKQTPIIDLPNSLGRFFCQFRYYVPVPPKPK